MLYGAEAPAALRLGAVGIVLGGTVIGFVAPNPYLYPGPRPGPISRMIELGVQRTEEMKHQGIERPDARLHRIAERWRAAARRVFFTHAIFQFPGAWALQAGFTLAGLLVLSHRALQRLREHRPGTELVVLALGGCLVVPAILSPLDWARYYLFAVLFAALCAAVAVSAGFRLALTRAPAAA
jgi:hypothetical protein